MRRPPDVRRFLSTAIAHLVLIAFSAAILLPLLWVLRVSLTDKLTAYRIPPRWTVPSLENYVEHLYLLPVPDLVPEQPDRGTGLHRRGAPARDRDGLCVRPLRHRRRRPCDYPCW